MKELCIPHPLDPRKELVDSKDPGGQITVFKNKKEEQQMFEHKNAQRVLTS